MSNRLAHMEKGERLRMASTLGLRDLDLHLQAKVNVETARLDAFELLLRGTDEKGPVAPTAILERVRAKGKDLEFNLAMTSRAMQISRELHAKGPRVPVAFNLDEVDLLIDGLPGAMLDIIDRHSPDEHALEIEITEHDRHHDADFIGRLLRPFAERRMKIWIDDSVIGSKDARGTGDLRRLHALPINGIKIDRSLIFGPKCSECFAHSIDNSIRAVRHTKYVARQLGIENLVVEGIENECQLAWCRSNGIPTVQGFRFHRPEALDDAMRRFG